MTSPFTRSGYIAATCAIGVIGAASLAQAQTPQEFEVASVKQLDQTIEPGRPDLSFVGTSGKRIKITGNRVSVSATLHVLIGAAYRVKDYQVSGLPAWADTLIYEVAAKSPGDAVPAQDQVQPMLQALLADRFQLKLRRETKELPVYHMTLGKKNGLFKPAGPDEKFGWDLSSGPGGTMRSKATKESIGDFVQLVGVSTDRPVINKTGLTGDIDYEILVPQQDIRTLDEANRAIVDAVKEQLGIKLEPAKDPIDMLIVERVEKPSAN